MKTLKKRIRQYMLRVTGTVMVISLLAIIGIQVYKEQCREYENSVRILDQIEKFIDENVVAGRENGASEYDEILSLIHVNSDADYYVVSEDGDIVVGTTERETWGNGVKTLGMSLSKIKEDSDGFYAKINGERYYCVFLRVGTNFVGRCVSCSKMYERIPATTLFLMLCLVMVAFVLTYVVSRYMNRYVVDGIYQINDELSKITDGDMDVKVDIRTSEEFAELSDYINTMVGSLSDSTSKMSYILSKTNMFIGVYEYRRGYKPVRCTEYIPRIFSLELDEWRLLTSDYELFDEFVSKVRANPYEKEPGVYVFSENPLQYLKLEEMEIGNEVFGVVIDVTEEVVRRRKIEEERDEDVLTGLYNRRGLEAQIKNLVLEQDKMRCAALVMIDADGLKSINDTYGHEFGDMYLKKIGEAVNSFDPKNSMAARIGGDEFVLFLYGYEDEEKLLESIHSIERIQRDSTVHLDRDVVVQLRFSFGYCLMKEEMEYDDVLKTADARMYANKQKRKTEQKQKENSER